jgi:Flp pilus assembly protein CpaB
VAPILDLAVVALAVMVCGTLGLLAWTLGITVPIAARRARRDLADQRARLVVAERRLRRLTEGDR